MSVGLDVKDDFRIFEKSPSLAYFDSASTTLVPNVSVSAICEFLSTTVASARRGAHRLAASGSAQVEEVRGLVAEYLGVEKSEISFQKSLPSAVASIAFGFPWREKKKNKIVLAQSEEHSIMVALLRAAQILGLEVEIISLDEFGVIQLDQMEKAVNESTGITAIGHVTLANGAQNPLKDAARIVHDAGSLLMSDISRSYNHLTSPPSNHSIDIALMSANTGLMASPGLSLQWIDQEIGQEIHPGILGGSSVANVEPPSFEVSLQPDKFESGLVNVPAIISLGASVEYIKDIGLRASRRHLSELAKYLIEQLNTIDSLTLYGSPNEMNTIFGFNLGSEDDLSCHDIALFLDQFDIAVRSGLLCAHPLVTHFTTAGMVQVSLQIYNSLDDCVRLIESLKTVSTDFL